MTQLFDAGGRCLSTLASSGGVVQPNRAYAFGQPSIDYQVRYEQFAKFLPMGIELPMLTDFATESRQLIEWVEAEPSLAMLLNGPYLPLAVPKVQVADYGCYFESLFLGAAQLACQVHEGNRKFLQAMQGNLGLNVRIEPNSRHELLVRRMAHSPLVALFFPLALQGFSASASRALAGKLPPNVLLSGGIDTALAFVGYPDVLAASAPKPDIATPGIQWRTDTRTLVFQWWDTYTSFNDLQYTTEARPHATSGLLVLRRER